MKVDYFDLLSSDPYFLPSVGHIIPATLRDIKKLGQTVYDRYISMLALTPALFFKSIGKEDVYKNLSDDEKQSLNIFDLMTITDESADIILPILCFFFEESVVFTPEEPCFTVVGEDGFRGKIDRNNYSSICDIILQFNNIKIPEEDLSKVKSKKALQILQKIKKAKEKSAKATKHDENMELSNIMSAVANTHPSLNIINIWDLTVYQVWDAFFRLSGNIAYNIHCTSVSVWGDKDKHFDANAWFKKINTSS